MGGNEEAGKVAKMKQSSQRMLVLCTAILFSNLSYSRAVEKIDEELQRAESRAKEGKFKEANAILKELNAKNPNYRSILFLQGRVLSWQKKYNESLKIYSNLLLQNPEDIEVEIEFLRVLCWRRDFGKAGPRLIQLLERDPRNIEILVLLGRINDWRGNYDESLKYFSEVLSIAPGHKIAKREVEKVSKRKSYKKDFLDADKLFEKKKYKKSLNSYLKISKKYPKDVQLAIKIAKLYSWQNNFSKSLVWYHKAMKIAPNNIEAQIGYYKVLSWKKRYRKAINGLSKIRKAYPKNFEVLALLGKIYGWNKDFKKSEKHLKNAVKIRPRSKSALRDLVNLYKWSGQSYKGLNINRKILKRYKKDVQALIDHAIFHSKIGQHKKAIKYLEKAKKLNPKRHDIRAMLGLLYSWVDRMDDSINELQKSISLQEGDVDSYIALGRVYSWKKKTKKSLTHFNMALKKQPKNVDALIGIGNTYLFIDEWDKAMKYYKKALSISPSNTNILDAVERLERIRASELSVRYTSFAGRDYNTTFQAYSSKTTFNKKTIDYLFKFNSNSNVKAQYDLIHTKQRNLATEEYNYNVLQQVMSLGGMKKIPFELTLLGRYSYNEFKTNKKSILNLNQTTRKNGGYLLIKKEFDEHLLSFVFSREAFLTTSGQELKVGHIDRYGPSYDYSFSNYASILLAPSWLYYSTRTSPRNEYKGRFRIRLPFYKKIRFEYEFKNLTRPSERFHTGLIAYKDTIKEVFRYEFSYLSILSYPTKIRTHQFGILASVDILSRLSLSVNVTLLKDYKNDKDEVKNLQAYLTMRI